MKRYTQDGHDDYGPQEDPDGEWVRVEDVQALLDAVMKCLRSAWKEIDELR